MACYCFLFFIMFCFIRNKLQLSCQQCEHSQCVHTWCWLGNPYCAEPSSRICFAQFICVWLSLEPPVPENVYDTTVQHKRMNHRWRRSFNVFFLKGFSWKVVDRKTSPSLKENIEHVYWQLTNMFANPMCPIDKVYLGWQLLLNTNCRIVVPVAVICSSEESFKLASSLFVHLWYHFISVAVSNGWTSASFLYKRDSHVTFNHSSIARLSLYKCFY